MKYLKMTSAALFLIASLWGTGYAGTYVYYNDKGEVVKYIPSKPQKGRSSETFKGTPAAKFVKQLPDGEAAKKKE